MNRGCLIVTLGTPASPNPEDIKEFLRRFLSDPSVVDMPRWLWKPILNNIVLRVRPRKIEPVYRSVWMPQGSPLIVHTQAQARHTVQQLPHIKVGYATTYMTPDIETAIRTLAVDELVVIPLYPQYAPSTVAEIWRQLDRIEHQDWAPRILRADPWNLNTEYIRWYAHQIQHHIQHSHQSFDKIIFSYHGVPQRVVHEPDQYRQQCEQTTAAIMNHIAGVDWEITYQSKFGPGAWLQPATIDRMAQLPSEGIHRILVVTPGFFASCIETLDEIDVLNRQTYIDAGGTEFTLIPPPNSDKAGGKILASVYHATVEQNLLH
ncbi:ferrochelatase [Arcanobacterium phocae]|uniref:Coproporphyrin III ferrochelatase n=1 Tax=Arcanobacterium phocae TaxID=131112 RepID=A0A1H2LH63_9ACTO|nr:ferrochelatase [Arcanobacterium phocae]SDU80075.1 ferrochelatase [Arcanobacterium phocae]